VSFHILFVSPSGASEFDDSTLPGMERFVSSQPQYSLLWRARLINALAKRRARNCRAKFPLLVRSGHPTPSSPMSALRQKRTFELTERR
jgi:hypothetical protein